MCPKRCFIANKVAKTAPEKEGVIWLLRELYQGATCYVKCIVHGEIVSLGRAQ